jgi:hypothetical protein
MNDHKSNICKVCGRKLKNPKAVELGVGPVCFKRLNQDRHKKLFKKT